MAAGDSGQAAAASVPLARRAYRRLAPYVVFVVIYYAVLVYPPLRMASLAWPEWQPGTPALAVLFAGPAAGRLLYEWLPGLPARWLSSLVMTWMGLCFIAFVIVLPWELAGLVVPWPGQASGLALLGLTTAVAALAFVNAQRLRVRELEIPADAAGEAQPPHGTRLVQISDVHVGSRSGRFLRRVVRAVNALECDAVVITGDLVDFRAIGREVLAPLGELRAPAYFVIGNHERYVDCEAICRRLESLGITVLRNATARVGPLQLIGIDDAEPKNQVSRILPYLAADPEAFRVLLYHRPDGVRDAAAWGCHLMLCGHTHNGQIVPFNYVVRRVFPRIHGLYRHGDMHLYVSPGTGTWGPVLRLGSQCEVTRIRLV